jgi:hypothetical protein
MISPPLVKITSPTAAGICQAFPLQPESSQLLTPTQTPAEYLQTLQQHHQSEDSIKLLAHGMPDRESTWWATQSAQKVANPANAADQEAIQAAETWVKNPSAATQQQAAAAAAKTDYQTPGAWAAQAAAWAQAPGSGAGIPGAPPIPAAPGMPAAPTAPRLTPHAASGAVMLAAAMSAQPLPAKPHFQAAPLPAMEKPALVAPTLAMPKPAIPPTPPTPQQKAEMAKIHEPFIKTGTDIASGRNTWT